MFARLWKLARRHKKRQRRKGLTVESLESRMLMDASGLLFNFTFSANTPQNVRNAAVSGGELWASIFNDPVTVNVNFSYQQLGTGVLADTSLVEHNTTVSTMRSKLTSDSTSADDATAVSHLPTGSAVDLWINRTTDNPNGSGSATPYKDDNDSLNNSTIWTTRANAKSVGLVGARATGFDATMKINSSLAWDTDPTNGITSNQYDLVGLIAHELAHVMGVRSGVDQLDAQPNNNSNTYQFVTPLDLFRYSANSIAQQSIDFTADARVKFFSIDGGATNLGNFATGVTFGDHFEAGHWANGQNNGILDPAQSAGEVTVVTNLDVRGLDVIGWNRDTTPWQNPNIDLDVNDDGFISPLDVLIVINYINDDNEGDRSAPLPTTAFHPERSKGHYLDVTGDGFIVPNDVIVIINHLTQPTNGEGESSATFTDLGSLGFARVDDLNPGADGAWFEFQATRTGVVTVEALFSHAAGNVDLDLYAAGNLYSPVATSRSSTNNERIDLNASAGQSFFALVSGANPNVDFMAANLVSVNGSVVDVAGTGGADTFAFVASANYVVTANGIDYLYPSASVSRVAFHGGGGADSVTVTGSASSDTAYLYPKSLTLYGSGYQVTTDDMETQRIYAGGGSNYAYFYDSPGNDTFSGRKGAMSMTGSGFSNQAYDFTGVYAYANAGGYDTTFFYDTSGNDTYLGYAGYSYMYGSGYTHYASGFDSVYAYATLGGYDTAYFYDSSGYDYMYGRSNYAYIYGGGTLRFGQGFDAVYAYGYYGGPNTVDVSGVNYYFARYGSWQPV